MVKTIFKVLLLTIVTIVMSSLIIEKINVDLYSAQLRSLTDLSIKQACGLFENETYAREDAGYQMNVNDVYAADGTIVASGRFYEGDTTTQIYKSLLGDDFRDWYENTPNIKGTWIDLDRLYNGLYGKGNTDELEKYIAEFYAESEITPLNTGVTYIDKKTVEKIAKWNLVKMISQGNANNIQKQGSEHYAKFNGFKVYIDSFTITDINYTVYDTTDDLEKKDFKELTGVDPDRLGLEGDSVNICVADLKYSLAIGYAGVTPLKNAVEYLFNNRVEGLNGPGTVESNYGTLEEDITTLRSGGNSKVYSTPVSGRILYYVVK